ncbi:MAG: hypothetical protein SOR93_06485 [Clostridiales Family XIII bacterium]|nr:hypothetical protein [Clostridia bacterium]MDY3010901.1 hypothetical protein [Clostridiales Family XIII bacterium]
MRRIYKERMKAILGNDIAKAYYQKLVAYPYDVTLKIADKIKEELDPSKGRNIAYGITLMAAMEACRRERKEKALSQHKA